MRFGDPTLEHRKGNSDLSCVEFRIFRSIELEPWGVQNEVSPTTDAEEKDKEWSEFGIKPD